MSLISKYPVFILLVAALFLLPTCKSNKKSKGSDALVLPPGNWEVVSDYGAKGNDRFDDYPAFYRAYKNALKNGRKMYVPKGRYFLSAELVIEADDFEIFQDAEAVIDLSILSSPGTPNIHNTVNIAAAYKVRGDDFKLSGGKFVNQSNKSKANEVAVLLYGVKRPKIIHAKAANLYTSFWAVKGCTDILFESLEIDRCSHNLLIGSQEGVAVNPEVTGGLIQNIYSHHAQSMGDGMKTQSFTYDLTVKNSVFTHNAKDGIDGYVGCENVLFDSVRCDSNLVKGFDFKVGAYSGTEPGKGGYNRNITIQNSRAKGNQDDGFSVESGYEGQYMSPENITIQNCKAIENKYVGFDINARDFKMLNNTAASNRGRGFNFKSCLNGLISGNIANQNCIDPSVKEGFNFGFRSGKGTPGKNKNLVVKENISIGSGASGHQQIGFSLLDKHVADMEFSDNFHPDNKHGLLENKKRFTNERVAAIARSPKVIYYTQNVSAGSDLVVLDEDLIRQLEGRTIQDFNILTPAYLDNSLVTLQLIKDKKSVDLAQIKIESGVLNYHLKNKNALSLKRGEQLALKFLQANRTAYEIRVVAKLE